MVLLKTTGRRICRQLAHYALLAALLAGTTAASSCTAGEIRRQVIYPAIAVVVVLVAIVVAVSDVEAAPPADAVDYDCAVTNNAGQAFELWGDGRRLGELAPGQTCYYTLGAGAHELYWQPLEYGAEFYDLHRRIEIPAGRYYCRITLEAQ